MKMEKWEWMPMCENRYMISNYGRVKSFIKNDTGIIIEFRITNHGYRARSVRIDKVVVGRKIHRMVATCFVENTNPELYDMVNHIDGDKLNNHHTNLEWTDSLGNVRHAIDTGLRKHSYFQTLNEELVRLIRKEFNDTNIHQNTLGLKYNTSPTNILLSVTYKTWSRVDEELKNTYKINYLKGEELTEWLETKALPKIERIPKVIKQYNELSKDKIQNILIDYVQGMNIKNLKDKWSLNKKLQLHIIKSNELPYVKLQEGEIAKRYSEKYVVTNIGRVITNGILSSSSILVKDGKSKGIISIVAELFIPNPNNYKLIKTLDGTNLNTITKIDISNLGWFEVFNEVENPQLIIDEYNTTELTKTELRIKYNLTFEQAANTLKGLKKKKKIPKPYVSQKKPVVHLCKICSTTNVEEFGKSSAKTCVNCAKVISKGRYANLPKEDKELISKKNKVKYKNLSEEQLLINKEYQKNYRDKNRKSND